MLTKCVSRRAQKTPSSLNNGNETTPKIYKMYIFDDIFDQGLSSLRLSRETNQGDMRLESSLHAVKLMACKLDSSFSHIIFFSMMINMFRTAAIQNSNSLWETCINFSHDVVDYIPWSAMFLLLAANIARLRGSHLSSNYATQKQCLAVKE
jgi:hypothetical protein